MTRLQSSIFVCDLSTYVYTCLHSSSDSSVFLEQIENLYIFKHKHKSNIEGAIFQLRCSHLFRDQPYKERGFGSRVSGLQFHRCFILYGSCFWMFPQSIKFYHSTTSTDVWKMWFIKETVKTDDCSLQHVLRQNLG